MLPVEYCISDVEARAWKDGSLYLYGSHDIYDTEYCSRDYIFFKTSDFVSWDVEKNAFNCEQISWAGKEGTNKYLDSVKHFKQLPLYIRKMMPPVAKYVPVSILKKMIRKYSPALGADDVKLFAPDVVEKEGRYYLYFCLSDCSEGVAVSDDPLGPFTDPVLLPAFGIDPSVLVDEDGQSYYYWDQFSSQTTILNNDMISFQEGSLNTGLVTDENHNFHEGSSVRKRGDIYYYVFADTSRNCRPTCLGYATSKNPLGPYTYQGVIIDNALCDPESWNNHGCIQEYNGQWYVFYHRSSCNSKLHRRVCCEPIYFDENGKIKEVKMTSQGPGEPFNRTEHIGGYAACEVHNGAYIKDECLI